MRITLIDSNNVNCQAGRPGDSGVTEFRGRPWSSLEDIYTLLRIPADPPTQNDEWQFQHLQYKTGQRIYSIGQKFDSLYIVKAGFLKTVMVDEDGNEQILSFPMKGDLLGIDGIHSNQYSSEKVALSDCTVVLLPFKKLSRLGRTYPTLESSMYEILSRELSRENAMVSMLGSLSGEARVARFLAFLSDRYADIGYSSKQFNLRMTRQEIGSYLGMQLETVSRTLSAFVALGIISLDQRAIEILDIHELRTLRRVPPSHGRAQRDAIRIASAAV